MLANALNINVVPEQAYKTTNYFFSIRKYHAFNFTLYHFFHATKMYCTISAVVENDFEVYISSLMSLFMWSSLKKNNTK